MTIELPISKSIANRLLILQALHGDPLLEVSVATDPADVVLLHDILSREVCKNYTGGQTPRVVFVDNCGTAMRFLTAYYAQLVGSHVVLDGCERMHHRPIGQLVDELVSLGADIRYLGEEGYPPLEIHGRTLRHDRVTLRRPQSTQFVSALLLIGADVETDVVSPYIEMTRQVIRCYAETPVPRDMVERDWSAAAFWYERHALGLCPLPEFPGLLQPSIQGDSVAPAIFSRLMERPAVFSCDFTAIPDLYPAVAITCEQLGIELRASGVESLRIKESDRLQSIREHRTCGDHRIAMALLAADLPCDDIDCIRKSYPQFYVQLCASRS